MSKSTSSVTIRGGNSLRGSVQVAGAKNSVLKIIPAALFSNEDVILENVPQIESIINDLKIVKSLGGQVKWLEKNKLLINASKIKSFRIPYDLGSKYRTAGLYVPALVFRFGKAVLPIPKNCKIGYRPINKWVEVWEAFGINVEKDDNNFYLSLDVVSSTNVNFKKSTHMGTDMAILFSIFAPGESTIRNVAEEPEIDDLISFINQIGGDVKRTDSREIKVVGKNNFSKGEFKIMSDRDEIITFAVAALVTKGNITIKGVDRKNLLAFTNVLTKIGAKFDIADNQMRVWHKGEKLNSIDLKTAPYPGFMTYWQPLITLLLTQANGQSTICDSIYPDSFDFAKDLNRMGADIKFCDGVDCVKIQGPTDLKGVKLLVSDLSYGAVLVIGALCAQGKSEIIGFENIERGYEDFVEKLVSLGAVIERAEN